MPPGFTVGTDACRAFLRTGRVPRGMEDEIPPTSRPWSRSWGGDWATPTTRLLVSVPRAHGFSMPGMMDTILDVGLNDASVIGLAKVTGRERFAWDSYRAWSRCTAPPCSASRRRPLRGRTDPAPEATRRRRRPGPGRPATGGDGTRVPAIIHDATGEGFPQDPREQLRRAVVPCSKSWNGERAAVYRRREHIPDDLGTAVNIQAMVFGNLGPDSGSGVAFTRDRAPAAPAPTATTCRRPWARTWSRACGTPSRSTNSRTWTRTRNPGCGHNLRLLEAHYRDMCDVEFTIERGPAVGVADQVGTHPRGRVPDRLRPRGRRDDHLAPGPVAGERRTTRPPHLPPLRRGPRHADPGARRTGLARSGSRRRRLRRRRGGPPGRGRRARGAGPARDQPRRPARHDRRRGPCSPPRRQDQSRRGGRPAAWARCACAERPNSTSTRNGGRFTTADAP